MLRIVYPSHIYSYFQAIKLVLLYSVVINPLICSLTPTGKGFSARKPTSYARGRLIAAPVNNVDTTPPTKNQIPV